MFEYSVGSALHLQYKPVEIALGDVQSLEFTHDASNLPVLLEMSDFQSVDHLKLQSERCDVLRM